MIFDEKKYQHLFTAGTYPQGNFTIEILNEIAAGYDPLGFHEAPVWSGHPLEKEMYDQPVDTEPKALAWVKELMVVGTKLFGFIDEVTNEFTELVIKNKSFKRVSVELRQRLVDGKLQWYLFAVGLTNRPAVSGLEALSFSHRGHKFNDAWGGDKFVFEEKFNHNQNNNTMNQYLIKVAESLGITVSNFTVESSLQEAINLKVVELKNKISNPVPAVTAEDATIRAELTALKDERVGELVDQGIANCKILPAKRQDYIDLGKVNYNILKETIANMTVHNDLKDKVIKEGDVKNKVIDMTVKKFTNIDGSALTYREYLKLDVDKQKNFSLEEAAELKRNNY